MGWVVNATARPLYARERPGTYRIGGWVSPPDLVWTGTENLAFPGYANETSWRTSDCISKSKLRLCHGVIFHITCPCWGRSKTETIASLSSWHPTIWYTRKQSHKILFLWRNVKVEHGNQPSQCLELTSPRARVHKSRAPGRVGESQYVFDTGARYSVVSSVSNLPHVAVWRLEFWGYS